MSPFALTIYMYFVITRLCTMYEGWQINKASLEAKILSERKASQAPEAKDLQILRWESPSEKGVMSCMAKTMSKVQWKKSFRYGLQKGPRAWCAWAFLAT